MSKCDTVVPLIFAMKKRCDVVHIAAETIKKLYDLKIPELVEQVGVVTGGCGYVVFAGFLVQVFQLKVCLLCIRGSGTFWSNDRCVHSWRA